MTNRYDNNDDRMRRDAYEQRRQPVRGDAGATSRQRSVQSQDASSRGRLNYDAQNRDHGQNARLSSDFKRTSADYSRDRYTSQRSANQQQRQAQNPDRMQQRADYGRRDYYDQQSMANQQRRAAYEQQRRAQAAGQTGSTQRQGMARRQVDLDQSGKIPRYVPQKDPRSRQQIAAQRNQAPNSGSIKPINSIADRFSRKNGGYQARPNPMGNATSAAQGFLSTPFSYLVRIALIVILVAFFGIRMALSAGPSAELQQVESSIVTQQEQLDKVTEENKKLQESIDSRQATLDAYNALL